jgi:3-dehydroquinate synthetase
MMNDKKNVSKNVSFTLLNGIGKAVYGQVVSFDIIEDALDFYKKF